MYAPDINGRRLFSACLRREGGGWGGGRGGGRGGGGGGGIKAGFLRRGKRWKGGGEGEDGVEISKAFPFLCLARDDTTRKRIDLSLDSILFSRV